MPDEKVLSDSLKYRLTRLKIFCNPGLLAGFRPGGVSSNEEGNQSLNQSVAFKTYECGMPVPGVGDENRVCCSILTAYGIL
jgi:hypothetical protein